MWRTQKGINTNLVVIVLHKELSNNPILPSLSDKTTQENLYKAVKGGKGKKVYTPAMELC